MGSLAPILDASIERLPGSFFQRPSLKILQSFGMKETGKNRGLKREAELILLYYVPHEPLSRWIPPWAPKQKQSSLAPGFSWSPLSAGWCVRVAGKWEDEKV
jgi:hypothetical protein